MGQDRRSEARSARQDRRFEAGSPNRSPCDSSLCQTEGTGPRVHPIALAHHLQGMLDRGEVNSLAEIARLDRVTRTRITPRAGTR
jgi:hypothetical protein